MRRWAFFIVLIGSVVYGQTSKPAAAPVEVSDTAAEIFLTRGLGQLDTGDNDAAATTAADGLKLYTTVGPASGDSQIHTALNHLLAVANLRVSKLSPARTATDRALASRWSNDSLVFNSATVYVAAKTGAAIAVNSLDRYLAAHPDADENWVNLYGLALERAAVDNAARTRLDPKFKTLNDYQARLEAKNPGKHRWGSSWVEETEWNDLKTKIDAANANIATLQAKVDEAQQNLQQAQQRMAQQPAPSAMRGGRGGRRGGGGGGGGGNAAARGGGAAAAARERVTEAQQALDAADRGPQPKWDVQLNGITPVPAMDLK